MTKEKTYRWDVNSAIACVLRNGGKISGKQVSHPQPGIKVLGAMDYLKNHCKFTTYVETDKKKKEEVKEEEADTIIIIKKRKTKLKED